MEQPELISRKYTGKVKNKNIIIHFLYGFADWQYFANQFFVSVGLLVMLIEAADLLNIVPLKGKYSTISILIISLLFSVLRTFQKHNDTIPTGFEKESKSAQHIANRMGFLWGFKLALILLKDKIFTAENSLSDILENRTFVPITKSLPLPNYIEWIKLRSTNVLLMIEIFKNLLTNDLVNLMTHADCEAGAPLKILNATERIGKLYIRTVEFEIESRSIQPPEGFERIHEIQKGWTKPVQQGINQMINCLEKAAQTKKGKELKIKFDIKLEAPDAIPEFNEEVKRLSYEIQLDNF
jgi:hypothetical protein